MATLVLPIAGLLGHQDGKHMVATITVYFHPARSAGSMAEATGLALIAFAYAAVVSFASMAVSVFFGSHDLLAVGHAIVLIVFVGGGLGFVGWLKQKLGNPLVNVACSLTSLAIITVLTKEGAVQAAAFSYDKVYQVLKMVLMGILVTIAVSLIIKPKSARTALRDDLVKITDILEEQLTTLTTAFLTGSDEATKGETTTLTSKYRTTFNSLVKNLREAKFELYLAGNQEEYKIEARLVKCIERLSQSLLGLRSAATTQFDLITKSDTTNGAPLSGTSSMATSVPSPTTPRASRHFENLEAITEEPEDATDPSSVEDSTDYLRSSIMSATEPQDIFGMFIGQLGPSMVSELRC
jgi:gas vesicle protein